MKSHKEIERAVQKIISAIVLITFFCENLVYAGDISQGAAEIMGTAANYQNMSAGSAQAYEANQLALANKIAIAEEMRKEKENGSSQDPVVITNEERTEISIIDTNSIRSFSSEGELTEVILGEKLDTRLGFNEGEILAMENAEGTLENIKTDNFGNIEKAKLTKADGEQYFFDGGTLKSFTQGKDTEIFLDIDGDLRSVLNRITGERFLVLDTGAPGEDGNKTFVSEKTNTKYFYSGGSLKEVRDAKGIVVSYEYDSGGRAKKIIVGCEGETIHSYDTEYSEEGSTLTDENGNKKYFDPEDRPTAYKAFNGDVYEYTQSGAGTIMCELVRKETLAGEVVYFKNGMTDKVVLADGSTAGGFVYDDEGNVLAYTLNGPGYREIKVSGARVECVLSGGEQLIYEEGVLRKVITAYGESSFFPPAVAPIDPARIEKPSVDASKDGIDIYELKKFLPENTISLIPDLSGAKCLKPSYYRDIFRMTDFSNYDLSTIPLKVKSNTGNRAFSSCKIQDGAASINFTISGKETGEALIDIAGALTARGAQTESIDLSRAVVRFYVKEERLFTNSVLPIKFSVIARAQTNGVTKEYSVTANIVPCGEWVCVELPAFDIAKNPALYNFNPYTVTQISLKAANTDGKSFYTGTLNVRYEICDIGDKTLVHPAVRKVQFAYYPAEMPRQKAVKVKISELAGYMTAKGFVLNLNKAYSARIERAKELGQLISRGGETVVKEEQDNNGKTLSSTNASGMTAYYGESGRIDRIKEPSGEVYVEYEYDDAGGLSNVRMAGARERLKAAIISAETALDEKVDTILKELELRKNDAEERLESMFSSQISVFQQETEKLEKERIRTVTTYDENGRVQFTETYEVSGIVRKMNETREKEKEFIAAIGAERTRLEAAFADEKEKVLLQRGIVLEDIGKQNNELLRGILKQELMPVLNYLYRKVLGRDPSEKELKEEAASVAEGYKINAPALKEKISFTAENERNIQFRENVTKEVVKLLSAYAGSDKAGKEEMLKALGMSGENCVNITDSYAAAVGAWLGRQDAHFGKSAFIALSRMLSENGRGMPLEELAVKSLAADILAGGANPYRDESIRISLFAQGKILNYYGVKASAAALGYSDIMAIGGAFITLIGNGHYITVKKAGDTEVVYWDPNSAGGGEPVTVSRVDFERAWKGYVITASVVDGKKMIPADKTKKIKGSFFWLVIPVFFAVVGAIVSTAVAALTAVCAAVITAVTAVVTACAVMIAEVATTICTGLAALGEAVLGFASAKLGGLAALAFGKMAGGLSVSALMENAAISAAGFGVSTGVNTALTAAGVDPMISGIISSVITGGVMGGLAANASIGNVLKSAAAWGIKTAALAVGQHFNLPPAIGNIAASAGMALSGMMGDVKYTFGEAVKMIRDTAVNEVVMAGIGLAASAAKISALSSSVVMNAFTGALNGFMSRPDNRLDGAMTGAFQNITRSVVRAVTMGLYVPFDAEWNEDPYFAAANFMEMRTLINENGLEKTLELYMTGVFTADAARAITERGGIADFMAGDAEVIEENGEKLKKIKFGDNYDLYTDIKTNDIKGLDIGNVKERGNFAIDKRNNTIKLMDGIVERELNGEKYLYKVSDGIVVFGIKSGEEGETFEMAVLDKETGSKISKGPAPYAPDVFDNPAARTFKLEKAGEGEYSYWINNRPSDDAGGSIGDGITGKEEEYKRYILANGINNPNAKGMPGYFYGLMKEISDLEKGTVGYTEIPLYNGIYGVVRKEDFKNKVEDAEALMYNLINKGYINAGGVVQDKFWALESCGELELDLIFIGKERSVYETLYGSADHVWKDLKSWGADALTNLEEQTGKISTQLSKITGRTGTKEMAAICYSGGGDPMIQALNLNPGCDVKSLVMVGTPVAIGGRQITNTNVKTVVNIFGEFDILKPRVAAETFAESFYVENEFNIVIKDCTHVDYFYDPTEVQPNDEFKMKATKFIAKICAISKEATALRNFLNMQIKVGAAKYDNNNSYLVDVERTIYE